MTTYNKISEQIQRLYARQLGDKDDLSPALHAQEVRLLVNQVANELISAEPRAAQRIGDVNIPSGIIATYPGLEVVTAGTEYSITLPVFPMSGLPMDVGVFAIYPEPGPAMIPISTVNYDLLQGLSEGALEGQIGFLVEGRKVIFTEDPVTATVKAKLLINDITSIDGNAPFPLPPQMEATLIQRVLQLLTAIPLAPDNPPA